MPASRIPARLARAKQYLVIADAQNPRREAYMAAAEEIAEHREQTGDSIRDVSIAMDVSHGAVGLLLKWRKSGYLAATPYLMDEQATGRAAKSHTRKVLREDPRSMAPEIAAAMEDPQLAAAVAASASRAALDAVEQASSTERYMRRRAEEGTHVPPPDAASHQLGGVGPAEMARQLHQETMEPRIDRVAQALRTLKTHVGIYGERLALTDIDEFPELDKQVQEMTELFAFMLNAIDSAKAAKLANEAEGRRVS